MLQRVLESMQPLGLEKIIVVIGHQAQRVEEAVSRMGLSVPVAFVVQEPQLGTGHALMQVVPVLPVDADVEVLITCGDMPLIPAERYQTLLDTHARNQAIASLVTVEVDNPTGYGRVVMKEGIFDRIVEEKDATADEKAILDVNAGIYAADWPALCATFSEIGQNNAQGEFYLTDAMAILKQNHGRTAVSTVAWPSQDEILGINSRQQLSEAVDILSRWTAERLMAEGVSMVNPSTMTLAPEIQVGPDTVFYPGCTLEGDIRIGRGCEIGPNTTMRGQVSIGNDCKIVHSHLERNVSVQDKTYVGPFAHLRDNAHIGEQSRVGNFVEIKEARFGSRSNAAHLCYLGDATIGDDVNMGAGSIIANYDPIRDVKHHTVIADGVKVGCNSVIVSPVELKARSCVAAGSVITQDVEPWDLAIARGRQVIISRWVEKTLAPVVQATT